MGAKTTPGPPPASLRTRHNTTQPVADVFESGRAPPPVHASPEKRDNPPTLVWKQKSEAHILSFQICELT